MPRMTWPDVPPTVLAPRLLLAYHFILRPPYSVAVCSPGISVNLITQGAMAYHTATGNRGLARPGDLVIFYPGPFRYEADCQQALGKYSVYFQAAPAPLERGIPMLPGFGRLPERLAAGSACGELTNMFEGVLAALVEMRPTWMLETSTWILRLITAIFELAVVHEIADRPKWDGWDRLLARIEKDPALPSVKLLAREFALSPEQFSRAFRLRYGKPPKAYILDRRLDQAKSRILHGSSAKAAAFGSGFRTFPHFSRLFRQRFGHPPSLTTTASRLPFPIPPTSLPSCRHFFAPGLSFADFPPTDFPGQG